MAKHSRLNKDQKRKAKLREREKKSHGPVDLAYEGKKYKSEALIPLMQATEIGIYEAYIITQRRLTDRQVKEALTQLILQMREGPLPAFEEEDLNYNPGEEEALVISCIRRRWTQLFEDFPNPGKDNAQGVLRTLLSSIKTWSSSSPDSRGYLHFVGGFLRRQGINITMKRGETELPEPDSDFLEAGRAWASGDAPSEGEFRRLAAEKIREGKHDEVVEIAQQLIGEIGMDSSVIKELSAISIEAQRAMKGSAQHIEGTSPPA